MDLGHCGRERLGNKVVGGSLVAVVVVAGVVVGSAGVDLQKPAVAAAVVVA